MVNSVTYVDPANKTKKQSVTLLHSKEALDNETFAWLLSAIIWTPREC